MTLVALYLSHIIIFLSRVEQTWKILNCLISPKRDNSVMTTETYYVVVLSGQPFHLNARLPTRYIECTQRSGFINGVHWIITGDLQSLVSTRKKRETAWKNRDNIGYRLKEGETLTVNCKIFSPIDRPDLRRMIQLELVFVHMYLCHYCQLDRLSFSLIFSPRIEQFFSRLNCCPLGSFLLWLRRIKFNRRLAIIYFGSTLRLERDV